MHSRNCRVLCATSAQLQSRTSSVVHYPPHTIIHAQQRWWRRAAQLVLCLLRRHVRGLHLGGGGVGVVARPKAVAVGTFPHFGDFTRRQRRVPRCNAPSSSN
eukprot:gene6121-biopygen16361